MDSNYTHFFSADELAELGVAHSAAPESYAATGEALHSVHLREQLSALRRSQRQLFSPLPKNYLAASGESAVQSLIVRLDHLPGFVAFHPFEETAIDVPDSGEDDIREDKTPQGQRQSSVFADGADKISAPGKKPLKGPGKTAKAGGHDRRSVAIGKKPLTLVGQKTTHAPDKATSRFKPKHGNKPSHNNDKKLAMRQQQSLHPPKASRPEGSPEKPTVGKKRLEQRKLQTAEGTKLPAKLSAWSLQKQLGALLRGIDRLSHPTENTSGRNPQKAAGSSAAPTKHGHQKLSDPITAKKPSGDSPKAVLAPAKKVMSKASIEKTPGRREYSGDKTSSIAKKIQPLVDWYWDKPLVPSASRSTPPRLSPGHTSTETPNTHNQNVTAPWITPEQDIDTFPEEPNSHGLNETSHTDREQLAEQINDVLRQQAWLRGVNLP